MCKFADFVIECVITQESVELYSSECTAQLLLEHVLHAEFHVVLIRAFHVAVEDGTDKCLPRGAGWDQKRNICWKLSR